MLKCTPARFTCDSATPTPATPNKSTSFYTTHLGNAFLTWSRTFLGLSLLADLRLFPSPAAENEIDFASDSLCFRLSFFLPLKKKGSNRLRLSTAGGKRCTVEVTWDLSSATFSRRCGPEPAAGFFVAIAVDSKVILVAGDRRQEAYRRIKAVRPRNGDLGTELMSRRMDVTLEEIGRNISWIAMARFAGREREVLMSIDLEKMGMRLAINGERVLQVRRLRWKFRGCERVAADGGDRIQVSWDLYRLLFRQESGREEQPASSSANDGDAVIVLRFEKVGEGYYRKRGEWGHFGKSENWSDGSSRSWTTATSSQSVEDWESLEDVEFRNSEADEFTLVICVWKVN